MSQEEQEQQQKILDPKRCFEGENKASELEAFEGENKASELEAFT